MRDDFAVFILSHGRPDNIVTLDQLKRAYTGKWYIVIDNEDKTANEYYARYGDRVIMFDKLAKAQEIDAGDNFNERRAIVYARHACFDTPKRWELNTSFNWTMIIRAFITDGQRAKR